MKKTMTVSLCVAAVCLLATQARSQEHWYRMLDPGNYKMFEHVSNPGDWVEMYPDGEAYGATIYRHIWHHDGIETTEADLFTVDVEGNLWLHGFYEPQVIFPDAPYIIIDAPLWLGKTWENTSIWGTNTVHNVYTVIAEEDVSVPFGDFQCFVLQWDGYTDHPAFSATFWYNDGVGLVKYSVDDIEFDHYGFGTYQLTQAVIPVEASSWGAVKSLYH